MSITAPIRKAAQHLWNMVQLAEEEETACILIRVEDASELATILWSIADSVDELAAETTINESKVP